MKGLVRMEKTKKHWNDMTAKERYDLYVSANKEASKIDVNLLNVKPYSQHPDDWYLFTVLCHRDFDDSYITWLYNYDCGGFHQGHYDMTKEEATEDYICRRR